MKRTTFGAFSTAALVLVAGMASATTIYDESVNGDLDAIGSTNVNLVAGVNTIVGTLLGTAPGETDRFKFTQGVGMTVTSIVLSWANGFSGASIGSALFNSAANLFDDNFGSISSSSSISASFVDSTGVETGPLSQTTDGAAWDLQLSSNFLIGNQPWTLTVNTTQIAPPPPPPSAVPLPAGAPLLLAGLGGLAFMRRRAAR